MWADAYVLGADFDGWEGMPEESDIERLRQALFQNGARSQGATVALASQELMRSGGDIVKADD